MKTGYNMTKRLFLGVLITTFTSVSAFAQFGNTGEILRSGKKDVNVLLKEYLRPVGQGFGFNLNSGWFSTAGTHKTLGFDLTFNGSVAVVPDTYLLFNVQDLEPQLQEIEYISNGPETPTITGDNEVGAHIGSTRTYRDQNGNEHRLFEFDMPQGAGYPYVPAPMLQASVGLIKSTDVTVRYLPPSSMSEVHFELFGLGIKHEINQWLPGGRLLPVDLSVQAGFTNFSVTSDFDVQPDYDESDTDNSYPSSTWEGQQATFNTNAFTINALAGKTLPMISVFGGIGYQTSTVKIATPGSYPIIVPNEDYDFNDPNSKPKRVESVEDPVDLKYENGSSFHALVGARIKLLIFNLSASYTLSEYPVAQVGVGIGFR